MEETLEGNQINVEQEEQAKKKEFYKETKKEEDQFPFKKAKSYSDLKEIINAFPHLQNINEFNKTNFDNLTDAKCFVIRSNNDDDVHKAIKYAIWTSTQRNIDKLNEIYQECKQTKTEIFLFFSVVKSGQFEGVARLISHVQPINFPYWWQAGKWRSLVKIEWLFVKDVPYEMLDRISNKDNLPIIRSRDGTEMNWLPDGKKMMEVFKNASNEKSILFDFEELDKRELQLRKKTSRGFEQQQFGFDMNPQYQQQYQMMMSNMAMYWNYYQQQTMAYYNQMPQMQQMQQYQQQYQQYPVQNQISMVTQSNETIKNQENIQEQAISEK